MLSPQSYCIIIQLFYLKNKRDCLLKLLCKSNPKDNWNKIGEVTYDNVIYKYTKKMYEIREHTPKEIFDHKKFLWYKSKM